jgi:cytochrome c-type biogenesis protein CcmH/NrfF
VNRRRNPGAPRRRPALALAVALLALMPSAAAAAAPRATLPAIERQVMCAACGVPLNIAESPQADRERAFIQTLIDQGQTSAQIKRALVAQYGPAVLATPSGHGFGLAAYLVPIAFAAALIALLALLLPRWRRRTRLPAHGTSGGAVAAPARLSRADAARLQADLDRFDRRR